MDTVKRLILFRIATIIITSALFVASGCANINTVSRTTSLPESESGGVAIHLDAQQRLVLYSAGKYCAEPSPDALQAYASALGFGRKDASSLGTGQQSYAGSIGLRTQSITIMRDALYRMCEAYNNKVLGDVMVATLLGRSQDLTAVILAIEQLTGAVAANQIILTGNTDVNASANLVANDEALASAKDTLTKREAAVKKATTIRDEASEALGKARDKEEAARTALKNATAGNSASETNKAKKGLSLAQKDTQEAEKKLEQAEADLNTSKEQLESAKRVVETIQMAMDTAVTSVVSKTSGAGQFSVIQPRKQLSDNATEAIADAVQSMVSEVFDKNYTIEACMALLTSKGDDVDRFSSVKESCIELINEGIQSEIKTLRISSEYGPTAESTCIRNNLRNDESLQNKIEVWLEGLNIHFSVGYFLDSNNPVLVDLRKGAINHFKLKCEGG